MRCSRIATAFVFAMLTCSMAHADEPGADEVSLKNGGTIRGTVVSSEPGTSVKILEMGQKDPRTIPWSEVSDVERGKFAPKPAPQPGSGGPGYVPGAAAPIALPVPIVKNGETGVVRLHVDSPKPASVFQNSTQTGTVGGYGFVIQSAKLVCQSPCDKVLDGRGGEQFIVKGDFPDSRPFTVTNMKDDVQLKVQPGSKALRLTGTLATILGTAAIVVGGADLLGPGLSPQPPSPAPAIGLLVGGGVALVGGLVLIVVSRSSVKMEQATATPGAKQVAAKPRYWMGEF